MRRPASSSRSAVPLIAGGRTSIAVSGRSRGGQQASATVDVINTVGAPSIAIASPADNSFYRSDTAKPDAISGTITAAPGSNVQVNGVAAAVSGNSFTAAIDFAGPGITPVIARVTTPDGRTASDAIRVVKFTAPLTVLRSFPSPNAIDVDPGVALLVLFSNPLDAATVAPALRLADASGQTLDGETFVDADAVTFAPLHPLIPGTTYTFSIAATLRDIAGGPLAAPYSLVFTAASSAPSTPPQVDQSNSAGCFSQGVLTGHATAAAARMRLDVDGVTMTTTAAADKSFRFEFTFSGQSGFHVARVKQVGGDGSLSPETAVCFQLSCSALQVVSASLDRARAQADGRVLEADECRHPGRIRSRHDPARRERWSSLSPAASR